MQGKVTSYWQNHIHSSFQRMLLLIWKGKWRVKEVLIHTIHWRMTRMLYFLACSFLIMSLRDAQGCTDRFFAAKESNRKADSSVFSDTGLMALVCHHDRIIFMVNLHDAGEKQYNALAIIKQLFIELPPVWNVGILYDIGCQLHKSIKKVCFT